MQLFTGHVSSAITLVLWARSCVASGKNQKCKCPPGPCRRCEQVYQAGRGHWWVEKEAPSKGAWPTRSCQGEIAQSWQVFTFFPWEARKSSPLLKYWQPKGNNRCQAQILEAYHFSVYELTSSKGISVSGGFSETSQDPSALGRGRNCQGITSLSNRLNLVDKCPSSLLVTGITLRLVSYNDFQTFQQD